MFEYQGIKIFINKDGEYEEVDDKKDPKIKPQMKSDVT